MDLSKYNGISFRMRISQENGSEPNIRIVLYSDNIQAMDHVYPSAHVNATKKWMTYNKPFSEFAHTLDRSRYLEFRKDRAFRFAFMIVSDSEIHGHVDIDDIRLF